MEIQEKLYSVLMTEAELKMFAEVLENNEKKGPSAGKVLGATVATAAAIPAAAYGGEKAANVIGDKLVKSVVGQRNAKGQFKKMSNLQKKARDLGIKMRDSKTIQNAASNILGKIKR